VISRPARQNFCRPRVEAVLAFRPKGRAKFGLNDQFFRSNLAAGYGHDRNRSTARPRRESRWHKTPLSAANPATKSSCSSKRGPHVFITPALSSGRASKAEIFRLHLIPRRWLLDALLEGDARASNISNPRAGKNPAAAPENFLTADPTFRIRTRVPCAWHADPAFFSHFAPGFPQF